MQDLSSNMTDTEFKAYSNLYKYNKNMAKLKTKTIHLCEDDIAPQVNKKVLSSLDEDILIEDEDTVCDVFNDATFNGVVSYVVAPEEPVKGSACYKMLIGADDNKLYFFKKHKISEHKGVGFLEGDLKEINRVR